MKLCPTCKNKYGDDANFCPREECAGAAGPQRLVAIVEEAAVPAPSRFVPVSRIGGGLSGEVWQASDAQSGGAVAYKVVAAESLPTQVAAERALRELRQLQRASNPHIVKVVDMGKTPDDRLFVASELASGEPLDQVLARSGPMPLERVKRIAAQIGEGLLDAQKVGVVHRDLAAKNILVDAEDEVRIINFAIPRPLLESVFGVPEYMSPEQSEGKLIDQRSNTYSLGALIYVMLTGQPPHSGATAEEVLQAVQKGEITPPSGKRGGGLAPEVDRIVMKAMEKNSSRRPLTMRQFLTDVANLSTAELAQPGVASGAGAAAAAGARETAYARTMMFSGGTSDVQKLVAQAVAARQAAAGGGAAEPQPAASEPVREPRRGATPPPGTPGPSDAGAAFSAVPRIGGGEAHPEGAPSTSARSSHGAAVAATIMAMPAAPAVDAPAVDAPAVNAPALKTNGGVEGVVGENGVAASPGPGAAGQSVSPADPSAANAAPSAAAAADPANFRETLWFKKGDVDQMVAEARAKMAAVAESSAAVAPVVDKPSGDAGLAVEDAKPLEDRYVDDGTLTVDDRKKFSLKSGPTSTTLRPGSGSVPGERMSEDEILDEIGGGKRFVIIGIVGAVVVALIAVVVVSLTGKGKDKAPEGTPAVTEPAAAAPPKNSVPLPPPAMPAAQPASPPPPAAAAAAAPPRPVVAAPVAERAEPAPRAAAAKKKALNKKKTPPPAKKRR